MGYVELDDKIVLFCFLKAEERCLRKVGSIGVVLGISGLGVITEVTVVKEEVYGKKKGLKEKSKK